MRISDWSSDVCSSDLTPRRWAWMRGASCAPPGIGSFSCDDRDFRRRGGTMRALITRPRENAGAIARALSEFDIEPIQEPLLEIRATGHGPIELDGVQAIMLTSAFGARELARSEEHTSELQALMRH